MRAFVEAALSCSIRFWLMPLLARHAEPTELVKEHLRTELGREPTTDELMQRLGFPRHHG